MNIEKLHLQNVIINGWIILIDFFCSFQSILSIESYIGHVSFCL